LTCCSLGMEPLLIENGRELECLGNLTKKGTWTGNFNYWTAGTQKNCRGTWSWCGNGGAKVVNADVTWDKDQPDNKGGREDCIHLKLKKNATGHPQEFVLTDRNCTDKYIVACKVTQVSLLIIIFTAFNLKKGKPSRPKLCTSLNCSFVQKPEPCQRNV
jgi:Lectin C-type domain